MHKHILIAWKLLAAATVFAECSVADVVMRSNLYFGTRTTEPHPIMTGMAWGSATDGYGDLRHSCQHEHKLQNWGWIAHDGRSAGTEIISDKVNNLMGNPDSCSAWHLTINGTALGKLVDRRTGKRKSTRSAETATSLFLYTSVDEGRLSTLEAQTLSDETAVTGFAGRHHNRTFAMLVSSPPTNVGPKKARTHVNAGCGLSEMVTSALALDSPPCGMLEHVHQLVYEAPAEQLWKVGSAIQTALQQSVRRVHSTDSGVNMKLHRIRKQLEEADPLQFAQIQQAVDTARLARIIPHLDAAQSAPSGNVGVLQFILSAPFSLTLTFLPDTCIANTVPTPLQLAQTAGIVRGRDTMQKSGEVFSADACQRLGLCDGSDGTQQVALRALANLLGSITYFYGSQIVDYGTGPQTATPHGLRTGVPSRSFFPRGFLWDEGFHSLIVSQWDGELARDILLSWLNTSDANGWIAREQILGEEARSRVPDAFRLQRPDIANPPTLVMALFTLIAEGLCHEAWGIQADGHVQTAEEENSVNNFCHGRILAATASTANPCLYACDIGRSHEAARLNRTASQVLLNQVYLPLTRHFEWYLRTQKGPVEGSFRWRGATPNHNFASGLDDYPRGVFPTDSDENVDLLAWMAMVANLMEGLAVATDRKGDADRYRSLHAAFKARLAIHWDEQAGMYCDLGVATVRASAEDIPVVQKICHFGYVSLFPFLLRLMDPMSTQFSRTLDRMSDPAELWSSVGLRSLSMKDPHYKTLEDYWRQAVWVNINYMAVASLKYYAALTKDTPVGSRCADMAEKLSSIVLNGVVSEYERSGFIWENYDSSSGHGRGTHPFTGWSALVALIAANRYPF